MRRIGVSAWAGLTIERAFGAMPEKAQARCGASLG
jgi:hypothetical protein